MRWFRTNKEFGGRLALFALAVQLVLSFGHIHREDIYGSRAALPSVSDPAPAADGFALLPTNHPAKHADDYCAICATIHLLNATFVAAPPQLALPFVSYAIEHIDRVADVILAPQRTSFQARAPPRA
jgi:hypothetical protein